MWSRAVIYLVICRIGHGTDLILAMRIMAHGVSRWSRMQRDDLDGRRLLLLDLPACFLFPSDYKKTKTVSHTTYQHKCALVFMGPHNRKDMIFSLNMGKEPEWGGGISPKD